MGQAVAATDTIETDTLQSDTDDGNNSRNDGREPDKSYLAAREFWVDYAGLTAYPGEHLRFGRQRLREDSGQWQDTNIEALNWSFETTPAQRPRRSRPAFQRIPHRPRRTGSGGQGPHPCVRRHLHPVGAAPPHRRAHPPRRRQRPPAPPRRGSRQPRQDLYRPAHLARHQATGDAYNYRSSMPLNYWASATWLTGDRDNLTTTTVDDRRIATGKQSGDVNAFGVDLGLRWNIDEQWKAGVGYARGSGGGGTARSSSSRPGWRAIAPTSPAPAARAPLRRSLPRRTEQPPGSHPVRLLATARGLRREPGLPQVLARRRRLRHRYQRHQRRPATGREGHRPGTRPGGDQVLQARPAAGLDEPVRRRALGADPLPRRPVRRATPTGRAPTRPCTAPSSTSSGASEPREETGHARHFLSIPAAGSRACARWPRQCSARCCCTARRGRRSRWRNRSRSRRRPATSRA